MIKITKDDTPEIVDQSKILTLLGSFQRGLAERIKNSKDLIDQDVLSEISAAIRIFEGLYPSLNKNLEETIGKIAKNEEDWKKMFNKHVAEYNYIEIEAEKKIISNRELVATERASIMIAKEYIMNLKILYKVLYNGWDEIMKKHAETIARIQHGIKRYYQIIQENLGVPIESTKVIEDVRNFFLYQILD